MDLSLKMIDNIKSSCLCKFVNYAQQIKYMPFWGRNKLLKSFIKLQMMFANLNTNCNAYTRAW